jgi:hypothetical protein
MNKVIWIVQTNLIKDSTMQGVWLSAEECGCEVRAVNIRPHADDLVEDEEFAALHAVPENILVPYGSLTLNRLSYARGWRGNCFDRDTFSTQVWNEKSDDMLNSEAYYMRMDEVADFFADKPGISTWFIRPMQDTKSFTGSVTEAEEIIEWSKKMAAITNNPILGAWTMVNVSPVKKLFSESRFFIVDGKVVDGSYYMFGGKITSSHIDQPETLQKAQELADKWLPHPCCVMDLADTEDGVKIVEWNTIGSSGFYDHDIRKIVYAMTEWAKKLPIDRT